MTTSAGQIPVKEGYEPWVQAIAQLATLTAEKPLTWEDGIAMAARDHCTDM